MTERPAIKLGFIPANRGFFSSELAAKMRAETIAAMTAQSIDVVAPNAEQTNVGCVETRQEAELVAEMFRAEKVQGIVIGVVRAY